MLEGVIDESFEWDWINKCLEQEEIDYSLVQLLDYWVELGRQLINWY